MKIFGVSLSVTISAEERWTVAMIIVAENEEMARIPFREKIASIREKHPRANIMSAHLVEVDPSKPGMTEI